jgi:hypothetical protein
MKQMRPLPAPALERTHLELPARSHELTKSHRQEARARTPPPLALYRDLARTGGGSVPEGASLLDASGLVVNATLNQWQGKTYFLCLAGWAIECRKRPDARADKVLKFVLLNQSIKGVMLRAEVPWRIGWSGRIVPRVIRYAHADDRDGPLGSGRAGAVPVALRHGPGWPAAAAADASSAGSGERQPRRDQHPAVPGQPTPESGSSPIVCQPVKKWTRACLSRSRYRECHEGLYDSRERQPV